MNTVTTAQPAEVTSEAGMVTLMLDEEMVMFAPGEAVVNVV